MGWITGAIKHPGAERNAAAKAGMSTRAYMEKEKTAPGKAGQRARLGLTLEGMHHPRKFGGPVTAGRPSLVGERGPETFIPKKSGVILPHPMAGAGIGMRSGQALPAPHLSQNLLHAAILKGLSGGRL